MLLLYNTAKSKGFVRFVTYSCSIAKVFVFHHTECDAPSALQLYPLEPEQVVPLAPQELPRNKWKRGSNSSHDGRKKAFSERRLAAAAAAAPLRLLSTHFFDQLLPLFSCTAAID